MTDLTFDASISEPRRLPWGALASLGLHGALALAVIFLSPLRELVVPPPEPVAVEIITAQQFAALQAADASPPLAAPAPSADTAPATQPDATTATPAPAPAAATGMIAATEFYAANMLREPGMARIRQTLTTLADSERIVQLCNIEALEQIRRAVPAFHPDTMVAYAMSDMMWQGMTLTAEGGAFRSRRQWYGVAFHCTVASGYGGVAAFDFKLGEPIPQSDWEAHNLNVEDADDD
ncbi:MAG: DUF930 domain-containing protein [Devosia nanyangense]|uniref:DUF930 domain-containing protein n=1 Tax=Devosia nanyangense TaxID=1228055 RepID=A0A933NYG8_9HYPH|nr:DUF930 domain-containing protein [Devosia nanyangense]